MPRITSRTKLEQIAQENGLYLLHLRRTGNASLAARFARRARETFTGRRRTDAAFDAACEAALVFARAALSRNGGAGPVSEGAGLVADGGEYRIGANRNSGLQVRRARAGHVTARGEAAFLEALSATANIRMAAESVGVDARAFYKRRAQSPDFARRMGEALAAGYEAVEFALLDTALRSLAPQGGAEGEAAGPVEAGARMSVDQALALIAQRAKTTAINGRHASGAFHPMPTPEETNAAILKRLRALDRKREREGRREDDGA